MSLYPSEIVRIAPGEWRETNEWQYYTVDFRLEGMTRPVRGTVRLEPLADMIFRGCPALGIKPWRKEANHD